MYRLLANLCTAGLRLQTNLVPEQRGHIPKRNADRSRRVRHPPISARPAGATQERRHSRSRYIGICESLQLQAVLAHGEGVLPSRGQEGGRTVSALHWQLRHVQGTEVVELAGYVGAAARAQLVGAIEWTMATTTAPIVIDLNHLLSWSVNGEQVITDVVARVRQQGRSVVLCSAAHALPSADPGHPWNTFIVVADVAEAWRALNPAAE